MNTAHALERAEQKIEAASKNVLALEKDGDTEEAPDSAAPGASGSAAAGPASPSGSAPKADEAK